MFMSLTIKDKDQSNRVKPISRQCSNFLTFSRGIEMEQWHGMGYKKKSGSLGLFRRPRPGLDVARATY